VILDLLSLYGSSLTAPPLNITTTLFPGNHDSDSNSAAWVAPIAIVIPLMLLSVVCVIWSRSVYKRGKKRYWQRVQNEHLMAYGATEESGIGQGQSYSIGELYENKYFESEYESANKSYTTKGDEDEDSKSMSKDNSLVHHDQPDSSTYNGSSTISAKTVTTALQQEDSGVSSNGTCTVDISDNEAEPPQEKTNDDVTTTDDDEKIGEETSSLKETNSLQTHEHSPEKILVTDV